MRRDTPMRCFRLEAFGTPLSEHADFAPVPVGTEVLVRVTGAGVCHSDVHIRDGYYETGGGNRASFAGRVNLPLTPGHEIAGEAVAAGPDAGEVPMGRPSLVCPWIGCGHCPACDAGDEHLCAAPQFLGLHRNGGYSDYVLVPHPRYLIDLGGLDPVEAAPYACSGLTAYSGLKKLMPGLATQPVVVIGAGGLGLMSLGMLKLLGGKGAVVVEPDARRRQAAMDAGALAAVDPGASDVAARIQAAVGAPILGVIDFVGSGETALLGFNLLAKGGKLVVVGLFGGALTLPVPMLPTRAATIQGSYVGSPAELREMMDLVRSAKLPSIPITRRPLPDADAAIDDLKGGRVVGRVVLVP